MHPSRQSSAHTAEYQRLGEDARREKNWKRWGPYLSERQWGTVREDYSEHGDCWTYFPHDHARSRAYRWGEDGLLGICDRECRLAFALAMWNGRDPILKERLFGLTGHEGNHGEDVKECYYYLDSTPSHSYMKALYKYPQRAFPYAALVAENGRREHADSEYELCVVPQERSEWVASTGDRDTYAASDARCPSTASGVPCQDWRSHSATRSPDRVVRSRDVSGVRQRSDVSPDHFRYRPIERCVDR